jgi:hypothetical protein
MAWKASRLIAGIALCLASACGSPGAYDVCIAQCNGDQRCGYSNDDQTATCDALCDSNKGVYEEEDTGLMDQCKNAGTIRSEQVDCYNTTSCGASASAYTTASMTCFNNAQEPGNCVTH